MKQARKAISETASENPVHRKRGRQAVYSEQLMNLARQYSDASTVRGKQNFLYRTRAVNVLAYEPEFYWLVRTREGIRSQVDGDRRTARCKGQSGKWASR